jgi:hypothetical protein
MSDVPGHECGSHARRHPQWIRKDRVGCHRAQLGHHRREAHQGRHQRRGTATESHGRADAGTGALEEAGPQGGLCVGRRSVHRHPKHPPGRGWDAPPGLCQSQSQTGQGHRQLPGRPEEAHRQCERVPRMPRDREGPGSRGGRDHLRARGRCFACHWCSVVVARVERHGLRPSSWCALSK